MEKIIVISDSHCNSDFIKRVLKNEKKFSKIFHLGDNYPDLEKIDFSSSDPTIFRVPGLFDSGYSNSNIPTIVKTEVCNWKFLLVHDLKDATKNTHQVDFYLYGHTHQWKLEKKWGVFFLNPGHIKRNYDRGNLASYCVLAVDEDNITVDFKHINGKTYYSKKIFRLEEK